MRFSMHVFCDESGNSGANLLNRDQPLFSLASTSLSEEVSRELLAPLLRSGQVEAKYTKLKGTTSGQKALLQLFASPVLAPEVAKVLVADKRFYLITHMVDKLIEPPLHEAGLDLYAGDSHVGLVNVWYHAGKLIFPKGHWNRVMEAFVTAIRRRNTIAFSQFDAVLLKAYREAPPDLRDFATGLFMARGRLDEFIGVYEKGAVFDPAVDLFIDMINQWMGQHPGMITVTHDRSKPLMQQDDLLRSMMMPLSPRKIGYGERQAELPLRIDKLKFGDSKVHPQLQLADLIAGAAIDGMLGISGRRPRSSYHDALQSTSFETLFVGGLLPSTKPFERSNEPAQGQRNLVDGSVDFFREVTQKRAEEASGGAGGSG
jgi:hypothetical protein